MKKHIKQISFMLLLALASLVKAQTGNSCTDAIPLSTIGSLSMPAANTKWIVCPSGKFLLHYNKSNGSDFAFRKYTIYSGNCSGLVMLRTDSNPNLDSTFTFRSDGNNTLVKLEFVGTSSNNILMQVYNLAPSACGANPACELINNGNFSDLDPCLVSTLASNTFNCGIPNITSLNVLGSPFFLGFQNSAYTGSVGSLVNGWEAADLSPQIVFTPGTPINYHAFMWTQSQTAQSSLFSEGIINTLCSPTVAGQTYALRLKYAFQSYTSNNPTVSSGTAVDQLIGVFTNSSGGTQVFIIAANFSNTSFVDVNLSITPNAVYDQLYIYPQNTFSTNNVSAVRVDDISLKTAPLLTVSANTIFCTQTQNLSNTNANPFINVSPTGGFFTGSFITNSGSTTGPWVLNPSLGYSQNTPGTFTNTITYTVTDPATGCLISSTKNYNYQVLPLNTAGTGSVSLVNPNIYCTQAIPLNTTANVITNPPFTNAGSYFAGIDLFNGGGLANAPYVLNPYANTYSSIPPPVPTVTIGNQLFYFYNNNTTGCRERVSTTFTYNYIANPITATATPNPVGNGAAVSLSATPTAANTFSWNTGQTGASVVSTASVATTPSTLTYTATGANSNTCVGTSTVNVTVNNPIAECNITGPGGTNVIYVTGGNSSTYFGTAGSTISGQTIVVTNDLTLNQANTFSNCLFVMGTNTKLATLSTYPGPTTITIDNSKLFSCNYLWDGLYITGNNNLNFLNINLTNNVFSDMLRGVYFPQNYINPNIYNNTFSKNYTSILLRTENFTSISSGVNDIRLNRFDKSAAAYSPTNLMKKHFISPTSIIDYSVPLAGIYMSNTGTVANGAPQITIGRVGVNNKNTFRDLRNGIVNIGCRLRIENALFENINTISTLPVFNDFSYANQLTGVPLAPLVDVAIIKACIAMYDPNIQREPQLSCFNGTNTAIAPDIEFRNSTNGIYIRSTKNANNNNAQTNAEADVRLCSFNSVVNPFTYNSFAIGRINMVSNTFNNVTGTGILLTKVGLGSLYSPNVAANANIVNIESNTFNDPTFRSSNNAIVFNNTTSTVDPINGVKLAVYNNAITDYTKGVDVLRFNNIVNVYDNAMTLRNISNARGIVFDACAGSSITNNNIKTTATTIPVLSANTGQQGIFVKNSLGIKVQCNKMDFIYANLVFDGSNTSANNIVGNEMNGGFRGLVLQNSGTIGQQGSPSNNSHNKWGASAKFPAASFAYKTYMQLNPPATTFDPNNSSKLYVTTPPLNTENSKAANPLAAYQTGIGIIASTAQNTNPCAIAAAAQSSIASSPSNSSAASSLAPLASMSSSAYFTPEQEWEAQMALYETLDSDASLAKANNTLKNYYNTKTNTNIGKLKAADGFAKNGNVKTAKTKLNTITNPNTIEKLNQDYRNLVLELSMHDSLAKDSSFKSQVLNIANACENNGLVVKQARVLAQYLYNNIALQFSNNCASNSRTISQINTNDESSVVDKSNNYLIVPNPNNGVFELYNASIGDKGILNITIVDLSGKTVYHKAHEMINKFCKFDLSQLNKGIYLLRINNELISKLVIQ